MWDRFKRSNGIFKLHWRTDGLAPDQLLVVSMDPMSKVAVESKMKSRNGKIIIFLSMVRDPQGLTVIKSIASGVALGRRSAIRVCWNCHNKFKPQSQYFRYNILFSQAPYLFIKYLCVTNTHNPRYAFCFRKRSPVRLAKNTADFV